MNFLGHWLFSDPTPDALMGSLWPDFAKRPSPDEVSEEFLVHFDRHQWLDRETDTTPILEPLRQALRPKLRKTTPVVVDMLIDHHLAKHWGDYHPESLRAFTQERYRLAQAFNPSIVPSRLEKTLHLMSTQDWLCNYRFEGVVQRSLIGMSHRLRKDNPMAEKAEWAVLQEVLYSGDINEFVVKLVSQAHRFI